MCSRFFITFLLTLFISYSSFSQAKTYSNILPKGIEARPILDSINYLPDSLKELTLNTLKAKGFDLSKCFVDERIDIDEKQKTISIRIWDIDDLKDRRNSAKSRKATSYQRTHSGFYSGWVVYDIKTKTAEFGGDQ